MSFKPSAEYGKSPFKPEIPSIDDVVPEKSLTDPEKSAMDKSKHTSDSNDYDFTSLSAWVKGFRAPMDDKMFAGRFFVPIWTMTLTLSFLKTAELVFVIVMEMRHGSWATFPWKYGITMRLACEAFTITFIAAQFWLFHVRKYPVWLTYVHSTFLVLAPILLDRYSGMESPSWAYLKHLWTMRVNGGGDCAGVVWLNLD